MRTSTVDAFICCIFVVLSISCNQPPAMGCGVSASADGDHKTGPHSATNSKAEDAKRGNRVSASNSVPQAVATVAVAHQRNYDRKTAENGLEFSTQGSSGAETSGESRLQNHDAVRAPTTTATDSTGHKILPCASSVPET